MRPYHALVAAVLRGERAGHPRPPRHVPRRAVQWRPQVGKPRNMNTWCVGVETMLLITPVNPPYHYS